MAELKSLSNGTRHIEKLGKFLMEASEHSRMEVKQRYKNYLEKVKAYSEVINTTGDDSDLYTTAIAALIDEAFEPVLLSRGLITPINLDLAGSDSIKIPKDNKLTATKVNDDGTFSSESTEGFDSTTISIDWYGTYTSIPQQLLEKSAVDLVAFRLAQIGRAIARKVDTDIIAEFDGATTAGDAFYGTNNNSTNLGTSTDITYAALVQGIADHMALDAKPTDILLTPAQWAKLMQDADMKNALAFGTTQQGDVKLIQSFGELKIHVSTQVPENTIFLVDRNETGFFIDASPIQTWDGRVDNTIQFEVVAAKAYGVRISRPESLYALRANTA